MKSLIALIAAVFCLAAHAFADAGEVTHYITVAGPSSSGTIPAGVSSWTFTVLSGSATIQGASVPAGFSDADHCRLKVPIVYTTGANSSLYIRFVY